jgi:hypothetical protein
MEDKPMDLLLQGSKASSLSKPLVNKTLPLDRRRSSSGSLKKNSTTSKLSIEISPSVNSTKTHQESPIICLEEEKKDEACKTMEIKSTLQFDKSQHYMMVILPSQKPGHRKISLKNADELKTFTEAYQINTTQPVKEIVSDTKIQY